MSVREGPPQPAPPPKDETVVTAQQARGAEIVLRTRRRRWVFFSLFAIAILGMVALGILIPFA